MVHDGRWPGALLKTLRATAMVASIGCRPGWHRLPRWGHLLQNPYLCWPG
ncbi:hypothetical protein BCO71033_05190 [Burkholderia contaminans]|uniref:Uncharacterized protein n=1 Tax=Burkholderia contaminans TaxID=488447 RepID=A0A6P3B0E3_9BURK|nr:hypothetical protein BCO71033_05190 [Burkholderia contaminans]